MSTWAASTSRVRKSLKRILAFDLGGTRLKVGAVNVADGQVESLRTEDVVGGLDGALAMLGDFGHGILKDTECQGTALCVPGLVGEDGIILSLPGKLDGIEGFDLPGLLESQFSLPAMVVNDAIAYGSGEAFYGAGKSFERCVIVTIGTGVGVTVLQEGRPIATGIFGGGILGGQIPISERTSGHADTSGQHDTIEALCCAARIVDYANEEGGSYKSVPEVYEGFEKDDKAARAGIKTYQNHLARGLAALAHAHTPDVIVLGGGPMTKDNPILPGVEEMTNARLFGTYRTTLAVAALGDSAALSGLARIHSAK